MDLQGLVVDIAIVGAASVPVSYAAAAIGLNLGPQANLAVVAAGSCAVGKWASMQLRGRGVF